MKKDGGWVFISHSHLDVEVVRKIRNMLEDSGFEPIMFYLKCLSDDDEVESLIKREIDEREWFIYVESDNSAKSKWVQTEREYISHCQDKKIFTINIDGDVEEQVKKITKQLKVYISYSYEDKEIFRALKETLVSKDLLVLAPDKKFMDPSAAAKYADYVANAIDDASREGFVLLLLSKETMNRWGDIENEITYAIRKGGKIIPIYIGDVELSPVMNLLLSSYQAVHIDSSPTSEQIEAVVTEIQRRIEY